MEEFWAFVSDPENQKTFAFYGGGAVIVAGALWKVLQYLRKSKSEPNPTVSATGGGVAIGGSADHAKIKTTQTKK